MKSITRVSLAAAIVGILFTQTPAFAQDAKLEVLQHWTVGDPIRWDYTAIDESRHHLFVTKGDHVEVLNISTGQLIGEIPSHGAHGVAFAQDLKLGFISNGKANTVTVFDLDTLKVIQEINVNGLNPDAILYDSKFQKVYTFNGKSSNITVIDAKTLKVLSTFAASGRPEFAVTDDAGKIYFNIEDQSKIGVIDPATDKLITTWPLTGCEEPSGLTIDKAHQRLFSVCHNKSMAITDAKTGQSIANVVIGEHPDAAVYDAKTTNVYSSNGDGTLTVIHQKDADHYAVVDNIATTQGARTMALDSNSGKIYLPAALNGKFEVLVVGTK
jgi:YVTN family beta-propeller protein